MIILKFKSILIVVSILSLSLVFAYPDLSFGQGVQTAGGVDVDGTWYLGEGLKEGNYFEYSLCEMNLNDCSAIKLKIWIKGEMQNISETLWDAKVVIEDRDKIIKGSMGLGKIVPEPILFDDDLFEYASAFKSSLAWMSALLLEMKMIEFVGHKNLDLPYGER